jgi:hypothetical protein
VSGDTRVVLVGLGPIGQAVGRLVLATEGLKVVGAADISPHFAGKDLGVALGLDKKLRIKVEEDLARLLRKQRADVAVVCTQSRVKAVAPIAAACLKRGLHVITSCEEMVFPTPATAVALRELDKAAQAKKRSLLATGVNPGFVMDWLALALTATCASVNRVAVTRVVDAGTRRVSLQRKVGAGLTLAQFRRAVTDGNVRHIGLTESAHMIAAALGWKLERLDETLEPAIAPRDLETEYLRVPAGAVTGIKQTARGWRGSQLLVSLDLQMYVGAEQPRDHILVDGVPPIDATIVGGLAGDVATAALVVNSIPRVLAGRPGLLSMRDMPLVYRLNSLELKAQSGRRPTRR